MTGRRPLITALLFAALGCSFISPTALASKLSLLENDHLKIGVDLDEGGSIAFLAPAGAPDYNVVNTYDLGRQIGVGYYSGPESYNPTGKSECKLPGETWKQWPWNAIQTGDGFGNPGIVLEHHNDGTTMYTKTIPRQWALNHSRECPTPSDATYETWIRLDGHTARVHVRATLNRSDTTQYHAKVAEMPGALLIGELHNLWTYNGTRPFTNDTLSNMGHPAPPKWKLWNATENWAALVNDRDWGVGVYHPGAVLFIGGYDNQSGRGFGVGGPKDPNTGLIGPLYNEILDHNIVHEYDFVLILGDLKTIRSWIYQHRREYPAADPLPDFRFIRDRQHWYYPTGVVDSGWPITGHLRIKLNPDKGTYMIGPHMAFSAAQVQTIYIEAAYHLPDPPTGFSPRARLSWEKDNRTERPKDQSVNFVPITDGKYHVYTLKVSQQSGWKGLINRFFLDLLGKGAGPGAHVDVKYVSCRRSQSPPPKIELSRTSISRAVKVGDNLGNDSFTVTNAGKGILSYVLTDNAPWLSVSPNSGISRGEADQIIVRYETAKLAVGTHDTTITITDSRARNSPQIINVKVEVTR